MKRSVGFGRRPFLRREGKVLHDDRGELGRGAKLSLLFFDSCGRNLRAASVRAKATGRELRARSFTLPLAIILERMRGWFSKKKNSNRGLAINAQAQLQWPTGLWW